MATKSLEQLRNDLKQAEQQLAMEAHNKLLAEFKAALDGKFFLLQWQWRNGQAVAVSRYSGFKFRPSAPVDQIRIEYKQEVATVSITRSRKTRDTLEPVGVTRSCNDYGSAAGLYDVTTHHIKEITKNQFDLIWDIPLMMADIQIPKWLGITGSELANDLYKEAPASPEFVVDVPFVTLNASECSILNASPYMLPNSRHLISPNAVMFAANRIVYEEDMERRVAHLAEECDRRYLEGKRQTLLSLKKKFKL